MRLPLAEESIDLLQETLGVAAVQGAITSENPDARRVRQRIEGHDRHRAKDTRARETSGGLFGTGVRAYVDQSVVDALSDTCSSIFRQLSR